MKNKCLKLLTASFVSSAIILSSTQVFAKSIENNYKTNIINSEINKTDNVMLVAKNDVLKDGKYNVNVEVLKADVDELSMAGQYIDKKAILEVESDKKYITLNISRIDWMENIKALVDDTSVEYETIKNDNEAEKDKEGESATIKFQIPNLDSNIKFRMNVIPMGNAEVEFRVDIQDDITKLGSEVSEEDTSKNKSEEKKENSEQSTTVEKNKEESKLPRTGYPIAQGSLLIIGGLTTISGILVKNKKR